MARRISQPISSHRDCLISNGAMGRVHFMVPQPKQVQVITRSKARMVGPVSLPRSVAQVLLQISCTIQISLWAHKALWLSQTLASQPQGGMQGGPTHQGMPTAVTPINLCTPTRDRVGDQVVMERGITP